MRKFLNGLVGITALAAPALAQADDTIANPLAGLLGGGGLGLVVLVGIGLLIFWLFFRGGGGD